MNAFYETRFIASVVVNVVVDANFCNVSYVCIFTQRCLITWFIKINIGQICETPHLHRHFVISTFPNACIHA